jgi:hypothetical protein
MPVRFLIDQGRVLDQIAAVGCYDQVAAAADLERPGAVELEADSIRIGTGRNFEIIL